MSLDPLNVPWGQKPKKEPDLRDPVPTFIGVRNEAVRDSVKAPGGKFVTIVARGIKGAPDGEYQLEWIEGASLKQYLKKVNLVTQAMHSAVRDQGHPEVGRLRMHYIPEPGAKITLGDPRFSSTLHLTRSSHDGQSVAAKMGHGARIVEVPLRRR